MGDAIYARDTVSSAGDAERYGIPGRVVRSPQEIFSEAQSVAVSISMSRGVDRARQEMGDCAYGVHVAGILTGEEATEVAGCIHTDVFQQARITSYGGLLVGAEVGLRMLQGESLEDALRPMETR